MKKYIKPHSEIVKLVGANDLMEYVDPFLGMVKGSATPPSDGIQ